ncbi:amidohydrolase/deacetylase family metallohydrolase [Paenibacillus glucanolyticus]|jgi:dihydroorotase|uniref:Amidohydrolase n=1 Tax=Paenibacillus glucanolyticus TaxID=59843 RepID=A0A163HU00_9BACL|nr:amidohydrolase [Paenibacillus glucanolyticus]AWP25509.1 amidohydrolase/deacetylase family metallohydrolase [Paenibacillus sp. Cedars]MDH6675180.1 dihydroorotase [Paenibacillus sp. LBL]AVV56301.1 amidohydrolase/deacetylase family metallohydrolase [Paenibacillus glucanolyticus]KZS45659.1 amidohydrolase [Paenibacillus glucanolyticus]
MKILEQRFVLRNVQTVFDDQPFDMVMENGFITEITAANTATGADQFDCTGLYVSSGWIDMHVHAVAKLEPYGDVIDEIGVKQGVATIIDAGSCGADGIGELADEVARSKTNVFAFLNISHIGLQRIDELSSLDWVDADKAIKAIRTYPDLIIGLKARISKSVVKDNGVEPLRLARKLSEKTSLPLMVHIGSGPPPIEEVLELLSKDDIITHYLNGKANNLFDSDGKPIPALVEAIARGVHLDVGHGTASFSFLVAEYAKNQGIKPNTISTDIYRGNRMNGPVYSLASVMTKFLYLGYSLQEVVSAVTDHAAAWLRRPELGRIQVGDAAHLTLFTVQQGPLSLTDSEGETRIADRYIEAKGVVVNGSFITC